jgi:hypothetical protein
MNVVCWGVLFFLFFFDSCFIEEGVWHVIETHSCPLQQAAEQELTVSKQSIVFASRTDNYIVKADSVATSSTAAGAETATQQHMQV